MITSAQIRAARAMLGWSAKELGTRAGLSLRTIQNLETSDADEPRRKSSYLAVKAALEDAGIEFVGSPEDRPGIRIGRANPEG